MSKERAAVRANAAWRWNPRVASRTLQGTAFVLLNSRMLRLNDVGTWIWEQFEQGASVAEVVATVVGEFETTEEQAAPDVHHLVEQLVAKEMLIPA